MQIFRLYTAQIKVHQIPHVIFQKWVFLQSLHFFLSLMRDHSSVLFRLKLYMLLLDRSSTSKRKFPDLPLLVSKLTKFLMSFLELRVSFFSNFPALFSVITHNFSEIYKLKQYIFWTKRAHQCTISGLFSALIKVHRISHGQGLFNFYITVQCHER